MPDRPRRNRHRGRPSPLQRRARSDIRVAYRPQFQQLRRQGEQAEQEAERYGGQISDLYAGLSGRLGELGPQYQGQVAQIQGNLGSALEQLGGAMPTGTPAGETAAAAGVFGGIGTAGQQTLASQAERGAAVNTSSLRQAAIDATNYQAAIAQDLQDYREAVRSQRMDLASQMAPLILARMDELRDRAQQLRLAKEELALRRSQFAQTFGLEQQRFGLEERRFGEEQRSNRADEALAEAQILDELRRAWRRKHPGEPLPPRLR